MRIEKPAINDTLAFNPLEYPPMHQEVPDPYQFLLLEDSQHEEMPVRVPQDYIGFQFDCFQSLQNIQLCEEEEMLLNFLIPGRKQRQQRCLKQVNYSQFITDSISQYETQVNGYMLEVSL